MTRVEALWADVAARHPRNRAGLDEARAVDPARFDATAETYLRWLEDALGPGGLAASVDAFAQFSTEVVLAQARYEVAGRFASSSFAEAHAAVYSQRAVMDDYLWGVYLTNFLWAHHLELMAVFQDRFVATLPPRAHVVELAPGHGGWGVWALHARPDATLSGFDIAPSSLDIAQRIAAAAGVGDRARYTQADVRTLADGPADTADALICCFLVEHLEQPAELFEVVRHALKPGGTAFLTGTLTAAQVDHIYEFRREGELMALAEAHGLRVRETRSVSPHRTLRGARFLPRCMALVCTRRTHADW